MDLFWVCSHLVMTSRCRRDLGEFDPRYTRPGTYYLKGRIFMDFRAYDNIEPFIPVYCRSPNQLIRYEVRDFDDGYGHTAKIRYAIFKTKKGEIQEMVAQVMWDHV